MASTVFTTRLDETLKAQLDEIARFEDRSTSYIATQAIRAYVEERLATRELIGLGLELAEQNAGGVEAGRVHDWLLGDSDRPFPEADPAG